MKKAELNIMETSLVIMIFIIIFIIGFVIFYRYTLGSINSDIEKYQNNRFEQLAAVIPGMGEFRCSYLGADEECIDLGKVHGFDQDEYKDIFGNKNITLFVVYPSDEQESYPIYFRKLNSQNNVLRISTPVSVYDPEDSSYKVGRLVIERFS